MSREFRDRAANLVDGASAANPPFVARLPPWAARMEADLGRNEPAMTLLKSGAMATQTADPPRTRCSTALPQGWTAGRMRRFTSRHSLTGSRRRPETMAAGAEFFTIARQPEKRIVLEFAHRRSLQPPSPGRD